MIKLKEVIVQLKEGQYSEIENSLIKNKAERFLFLFQSYKKSNISDKEIKEKLEMSSNSFYVLKSRLYDKIQESLGCDMFIDQEKSIKLILQVPEICFNTPRESAIAYLLKLEKELLRFNMHNELLVVYSALKKMHLNSDKYHHYSTLYNKQVSFGISLEKAEDTLGSFCRLLGQYDFSRSKDSLDKLEFLNNEIKSIYVFCNSKQIELIKNLIELQFIIFCKKDKSFESDTDELLQNTRIIFDDLPLTIIQKKWEIVLDYLCFEYYFSIGSNKSANHYFEKVNSQLSSFLLYNHIGIVAKFLNSKIKFCSEFDRCDDISTGLNSDKLLYDIHDTYTLISLGMYNAMADFYKKDYKSAIARLFELQNEFVFKDYFFAFLNIKLTLTYFYIITGELDKAQACIKILSRRLKTEDLVGYSHVPYLLKAFDIEINKEKTPKSMIKKRDLLTLFLASNSKLNSFEVLSHLIPEFKRKYQI